MTSERTWSIAELADELGVTHRTLRHYEQLGLLSPERRGAQRVYRRRDRIRLELILRGRRLGFGLPEIGRIIAMYGEQPGEVGQLRYLLQRVAEQREQLQQRRRDIDDALAELAEVERRCRTDLRRLTDGSPAAEAPGR